MMLKKLGGLALIAGAVLNMTRMVPIFLSDGFSTEFFPPHGIDDTIVFALLSGYIPSHIMAMASVPLFVIGMAAVYQDLSEKGQKALGLAALTTISSGFLLYLIAAVTDGIILPDVIHTFANVPETERAAANTAITLTHHIALNFAGSGAPMILIGVGIFGLGLLRAGSVLLGGIGLVLGLVSLAGYASGVITLNITESLMIVGPLMMVAFIYFIVNGLSLILRKD